MTKEKLIILGSGPAGITASIYAARANLNPLVITGSVFGGVPSELNLIENYPGFPNGIQGKSLMKNMIKQAKNLGVRFLEDEITNFSIDKNEKIITCKNKTLKTNLLIIATGIDKEKKIKNQDKFLGFGVSTCTTCDAPFFKKQKVAVFADTKEDSIKEAIYLSDFASEVFLITKEKILKSSSILSKYKNIKILNFTEVLEVLGEEKPKKVTSILLLKNKKEKSNLSVDGLFVVSSNLKSSKNIFKDYLNFSENGFLITKENSCATKVDGIFGAGDIVNCSTKQIVSACASGARAAMEAKAFSVKAN